MGEEYSKTESSPTGEFRMEIQSGFGMEGDDVEHAIEAGEDWKTAEREKIRKQQREVAIARAAARRAPTARADIPIMPGTEEAEETNKRVNFILSEDVYDEVARLARKKTTTVAEVLRDAIALELWLQKELDKGNTILVGQDDRFKEVIFPR